jgi:hypothetical protein
MGNVKKGCCLIALAFASVTGCKSTDEPDTPPPLVTAPALPPKLGHSSVITVPKILNELVNLYPGRTGSDPLWANFVSAADISFSTGYFAATTVMRIDTAGRPLWAKTYSMPTATGSGAFVPCANGGGLVVVRSPGTLTTGSTSFVVARLDEQGAVQWSNEYSTTPNSQLSTVTYGVLPTTDGGSVVYAAEREALVLFKLASDGSLLWSRKTVFASTQVENPQLVELPSGKFVMIGRALYGAMFTCFSNTGIAEVAANYFDGQAEMKPEGGQLRVNPDGTLLVGLQQSNVHYILQVNDAGHLMKAAIYFFFAGNQATDFDLLPTGEGAILVRTSQNQPYFYHIAPTGDADGAGQSLGNNSTVLTPFSGKSPAQVLCANQGICYSLGPKIVNADILYNQLQFHKTNRQGNNFCPATTLSAIPTGHQNYPGLAVLNEHSFSGIASSAAPPITVTPRAIQVSSLPTTVVRSCL